MEYCVFATFYLRLHEHCLFRTFGDTIPINLGVWLNGNIPALQAVDLVSITELVMTIFLQNCTICYDNFLHVILKCVGLIQHFAFLWSTCLPFDEFLNQFIYLQLLGSRFKGKGS